MDGSGETNMTRWLDELPEWYPEWEQVMDGELDEASRQALFKRIDQHPGGWKMCAMSLLWELSLRREMRTILEASRQQAVADGTYWLPARRVHRELPCISVGERLPYPGRAFRRWIGTAAVAASLVLAFSLGWLVSARLDRLGDSVAALSPQEDSRAGQELGQPGLHTELDRHKGASAQRREPDAAPSPWRSVTVSLPRGNTSRLELTEVPVREVLVLDQAFDPAQSAEETARMQQLIDAIGNQGGMVGMQRRLVTVELDPDTYAVIPIEQWDIELPETASLASLLKEE